VSDVARRLERFLGSLGERGLEAMVVSAPVNVRYLTGFSGSAGLLVAGARGRLALLTDGRYDTQARLQLDQGGISDLVELVVGGVGEQERAMGELVDTARVVGVEAERVTLAQAERWRSGPLARVTLQPVSGVVESLRLIKDASELDALARSAQVADEALADVLAEGVVGLAEREVAARIEHAMRRGGAEDAAFETIVGSGPNGAMPHHRAGGRTLAEGDLVVVDWGARVGGYCSDATRTVALGEVPAELARAWEIVREAQAAGIAAVAPGQQAAAVDEAARQVISAAGLGDRFVHATGHGVGLEVHEAPRVGAGSSDILEVGMVLTVEPGVYLPGLGGVRIEDTVVVEDGGGRSLTRLPIALDVPSATGRRA